MMHRSTIFLLQNFKGRINGIKCMNFFISRSFAKMSKAAYYAVASGRKPGIYDTWAECESQVKHFSGARYKKFQTLEDAQNFIAQKQSAVKKRTLPLAKPIASSYKASCSYPSDSKDFPPSKRRKTILIDYNKDKTEDFNMDGEGFVNVYTDGACSSNGRKGATAGIGVWFGDNHKLNVSKPLIGEPTNNRAEIQAVLVAVNQAKSAGVKNLKINTDSKFLISCVTKWMPSWKRNGWKTVKNQPVLHKNELLELERAMSGVNVSWNHVAGHAGIYGNEMADKLARGGCEK